MNFIARINLWNSKWHLFFSKSGHFLFVFRSLTELEQRTNRLTNEFQQTIENLSMKIEEQKHIAQVTHIPCHLKIFDSSFCSGPRPSSSTTRYPTKTIIWKVFSSSILWSNQPLSSSSTSSGNAMAVLRDKEEQIQQLLEEGEKLSKTQLQHTNIIKKLRTKEKENETQITSLK